MEAITGYFINNDKAAEAADSLRKLGFKGQISIVGRKGEGERQNDNNNTDIYSYLISSDTTGLNGTADEFFVTGSGFTNPVVPVVGLDIDEFSSAKVKRLLANMGISKRDGEEIRSVVEDGISTIIIKSNNDKDINFVKDVLDRNGAQKIQSLNIN